jgi:hypothetical protein
MENLYGIYQNLQTRDRLFHDICDAVSKINIFEGCFDFVRMVFGGGFLIFGVKNL